MTNLRLPGQYDERLLASVGLQGPYHLDRLTASPGWLIYGMDGAGNRTSEG